jgi:UDP-glucuronate 4-epimerase
MDRPLEYETTNVLGTVRLLEFARRMAAPTFVFASSSSVYGPDNPLPAVESDSPIPASPYALTKLHGEQWGALYARLHGLRFVALRLFSVWGDGQRPDLALEAFRRWVTAGQPVTIHGDGSQRRDLTHVSDVARAVALAIHWQEPGQHIFNIGTGRSHSVHDMLDFVANFTGFTPETRYQPAHPADVPETLANPSKAGVLLGWEPLVFFPETP